jgi:hypothetical protein
MTPARLASQTQGVPGSRDIQQPACLITVVLFSLLDNSRTGSDHTFSCAAAAGGRHHGLDSHYQAYLDSLQPYQPPSPLQAAIGSAASGAVLLSAAYTAVPAYLLSRAAAGTSSSGSTDETASSSGAGVLQEQVDKHAADGSGIEAAAAGSSSEPPEGLLPFLRWYTGSSQQLVWDVHDRLAPWLGSGSSVQKE